MTFHSPIWLYAGLVAAAAMLALYYWSARRQRKLLSDFASERLLSNWRERSAKQRSF
ncbi:MAG: BatA domain-containing protein [Bacilli bacterium]